MGAVKCGFLTRMQRMESGVQVFNISAKPQCAKVISKLHFNKCWFNERIIAAQLPYTGRKLEKLSSTGSAKFFCHGLDSCSFAGHTVSVTITQLCLCIVKARHVSKKTFT